MAWNPSPEVAPARDLARKLGASRVVAYYTTPDGRCGYVSFGQTRALCDQARKLADRFYEEFGEAVDEVEFGAFVQKRGET